jgi:hypothetical protein
MMINVLLIRALAALRRSDMKRSRFGVMMLMAPLAMTLLMGVSGCIGVYGGGGGGPEWDGVFVVGGGVDRYGHPQAFHDEGGRHPVGARSDRGHASMGGGRGGGGGHAGGGGGGGHGGGGKK